MSKFLAFVLTHKALIGTVLVSVGGVITGAIDPGAAVAAIVAAFSAGLKPAPAK